MSKKDATVLLIGYGNPGRLDDGLGPALAGVVESLALPAVTVDADYQLTVEDAQAVAEHDIVVFADADATGEAPFSFRPIEPEAGINFSTHSIEPRQVLGLAHALFGGCTRGFILGIRGYDFDDFGESLSSRARVNLAAAIRFVERFLREGDFERDDWDTDHSSGEVLATSMR
ncbi:MAG: hydrogenase maturation protease [Phycisphaerae bacterium]|nr:hydrogenase maturation protease [Phycisphaerae bacterium]